jgi:hypothetical protein
MNIPNDFHDTMDTMLVDLINIIMSTQMAASILIFLKTVFLLFRNRVRRKNAVVEFDYEFTASEHKGLKNK